MYSRLMVKGKEAGAAEAIIGQIRHRFIVVALILIDVRVIKILVCETYV